MAIATQTTRKAIDLIRLGCSFSDLDKITGLGNRHGYDSKPDDTIRAKYLSGALSRYGVFGVLFGTDSPQHHQGHNLGPIVRLECACCGESTTGRQWFNRDTGYGLCSKCGEWITSREGEDYVQDCYGFEGVHFGARA